MRRYQCLCVSPSNRHANRQLVPLPNIAVGYAVIQRLYITFDLTLVSDISAIPPACFFVNILPLTTRNERKIQTREN